MVKCQKCGYEWETTSKMSKVTCPSCGYKTPRLEEFPNAQRERTRPTLRKTTAKEVRSKMPTWTKVGGVAALAIVAAIGAWLILAPAPASWSIVESGGPDFTGVLGAAEPSESGLENVYIVDNAHAAGYDIDFSGNENVLGVITGSGDTAEIDYEVPYVIVVANKAHDNQMAYHSYDNAKTQLICNYLGISENKAGDDPDSYVFEDPGENYFRYNAVWDNAGDGFPGMAAGTSYDIENIALFCWS